MSLVLHTQLGPYEILEQLGAGGMGEVYRALDTRLQREVAIKVLLEQWASDAKALVRFQREMQAIASVSHPNIVTIFDVGTENDMTFAVMELLRGETLRQRLRRGPLPWKRALATAMAIAKGLGAAHTKGIIHRDIKPENIFLTSDDGVKILDFGLVRLQTEHMSSTDHGTAGTLITQKGALMGTVSYMAPEQVRGEAANTCSDVFAFGCVLHEMIAGRHPFRAETNTATMAAVLFDAAPELGPGGDRPAEVDAIILRCLEKEAQQRFPSGCEIVQALQNLDQTTAVENIDQPVLMKPTDTAFFYETPLTPVSQTAPPTSQSVPSVAVLPFRNLSSDPENEYFSDGLAEELIIALSKVEGLQVAARTSAFAFKGKDDDIRKIGNQLSVNAVLEGSVRKAGNRLRISAQLIKVQDGFKMWSETYTRELDDVFAIQEDIAREIAAAIQALFSDQISSTLPREHTANVKAREFCLRGQQFCRQYRRKGFEYALIMFRRAAAVDANYAQAYAGEASCHALLYTWWDADAARLGQARDAAGKALKLQPKLAEAHVAQGLVLSLNQQYAEAERAFQQAMQFNPNLFEAQYFYGQSCLAQGQREKAVQIFEKATQISPGDFEAASQLVSVYAQMDQEAEVLATAQHGLQAIESHLALYPDDTRATYLGAFFWYHLGEPKRALEWAECAASMDPDEPLTLYHAARLYALLGQRGKALDNLEKAVARGFARKEWIEQEADFAGLQGEQRFQELVNRV